MGDHCWPSELPRVSGSSLLQRQLHGEICDGTWRSHPPRTRVVLGNLNFCVPGQGTTSRRGFPSAVLLCLHLTSTDIGGILRSCGPLSCVASNLSLFLSDPARVSSWSVSRVARFTAGCRVVPVLLRRRSDRSYLIAFFFSNRNFSRCGNLSVLSTSLSSRQSISDHLSLILGGSRFSMTLTELVVVISRRIESLSKSR